MPGTSHALVPIRIRMKRAAEISRYLATLGFQIYTFGSGRGGGPFFVHTPNFRYRTRPHPYTEIVYFDSITHTFLTYTLPHLTDTCSHARYKSRTCPHPYTDEEGCWNFAISSDFRFPDLLFWVQQGEGVLLCAHAKLSIPHKTLPVYGWDISDVI